MQPLRKPPSAAAPLLPYRPWRLRKRHARASLTTASARRVHWAALQVERASVAAKGKQIETEAAPIRYVAELLRADTDSERAIQWLIALMVLCCDPLAIALTASLCSPFSNFRFDLRETGSVFDRDRFAERSGPARPTNGFSAEPRVLFALRPLPKAPGVRIAAAASSTTGFAGPADTRLRRSRRQYDLSGLRKYTAAARFPPRLALRSRLLRRPQGSAVQTWCRAECFP